MDNFHPEWGYLVPARSFIRTVRVVLVASIVGAMVGAVAIFSGVGRPTTESSVAARTLVRSIEAVPAGDYASGQATQRNVPSLIDKRSPTVNSRSAERGTNEPSAGQVERAPDRIAAALAEAPVATEVPSTAAIATPPRAAKNTVPKLSLVRKKAMKKSNGTWRFALRDEPHGLAPGEYSKRRSWGGYYWDGGGGRYENW
jgi:hypothetical protein